jgi:hypothetical protein
VGLGRLELPTYGLGIVRRRIPQAYVAGIRDRLGRNCPLENANECKRRQLLCLRHVDFENMTSLLARDVLRANERWAGNCERRKPDGVFFLPAVEWRSGLRTCRRIRISGSTTHPMDGFSDSRRRMPSEKNLTPPSSTANPLICMRLVDQVRWTSICSPYSQRNWQARRGRSWVGYSVRRPRGKVGACRSEYIRHSPQRLS